jgi:hypothetical protein
MMPSEEFLRHAAECRRMAKSTVEAICRGEGSRRTGDLRSRTSLYGRNRRWGKGCPMRKVLERGDQPGGVCRIDLAVIWMLLRERTKRGKQRKKASQKGRGDERLPCRALPESGGDTVRRNPLN